MRRAILGGVAAAVCGGLLLVGCGSDDGDDRESDVAIPTGWAVVTDEPSGIAVALPEGAEPRGEQEVPTADGGTTMARSYFAAESDIEVGFNVLDLDGMQYDLDAGLEGSVDSAGGTLKSSDSITVEGYDAVEAEVDLGDGFALLQLIVVDGYVLQPLVAAPSDNREQAEQHYENMLASIDFGSNV